MTVRSDRYRNAIVPHIYIEGASEAIAFYKRAFGAEELLRIAELDGKILHAGSSRELAHQRQRVAHPGGCQATGRIQPMRNLGKVFVANGATFERPIMNCASLWKIAPQRLPKPRRRRIVQLACACNIR